MDFLSRDLTRPRVQSFDFMIKNLTGIHHPSKFGDRRHYASGDIMVVVCRVFLEDHVI